jgi:hypothetical protein
MDSHILEGLTLRLEAAERELRGARRAMWMGSFLVVLAIGGGAWWVSDTMMRSSAAGGTIEAQQFVVRDAQGRAHGVLESLDSGGTQLVFFRDPVPGEKWRELTGTGPFSFGVRSLRANSQLVLSDREGGQLQVTSENLSFGESGKPDMLLATDGGTSRIWLADSTGTMQALSASLIADATKRAAPASKAPKRRRGR